MTSVGWYRPKRLKVLLLTVHVEEVELMIKMLLKGNLLKKERFYYQIALEGFFVLNAICYNCLPRVQTDRLFPLLPLHFLLSPVSRG